MIPTVEVRRTRGCEWNEFNNCYQCVFLYDGFICNIGKEVHAKQCDFNYTSEEMEEKLTMEMRI